MARDFLATAPEAGLASKKTGNFFSLTSLAPEVSLRASLAASA
jgi:hypothetical protein